MKGQGTSHPGKRYDSEFKRESVRLADTSGKTDRQIERDLGALIVVRIYQYNRE